MKTAPSGSRQHVPSGLELFAASHDFAELYRRYEWRRDNWGDGFADIFKLEKQLIRNAKNNVLTKEDVIAVAGWAMYRNIKRIECPTRLRLPFYSSAHGEDILSGEAADLATRLRRATKGLGPTTISKVLRFSVPREFGAIDTRIVRVVGQGHKRSKREDWLSLRVADYGSGPHIPASQSAWPSDYQKWVNILRFFVDPLNGSGVACPHPDGFVVNRVRTRAVWACADVEMALFGWASSQIISERRRCRDA
jgi:hypothetical protein